MSNMQSLSQTKLRFTGNWFIDAGILGFVNLMEEVYEWDLNKLQEEINKNPEKVYYGYFPFGYLYKWCSDRNVKNEDNIIKQLKNELDEKEFRNDKELFDYIWYSFICKLFKDLWVEHKAQLIYEKEAYGKHKKLKKQYSYKNVKTYIQKIKTREEYLNKILNQHKDEITKILKKKELSKLEYSDIKKLINPNNESTSEELKKSIEELRNADDDLTNFLKEEWKKNVIQGSSLTKEDDYFYRIPIDSGFYKNFLFFNNSVGNFQQKESFYNMVYFNSNEEEILGRIDKAVNKLLPSEEEFSNINYTKLSTESLKKEFKYLFVYLLCFIYAFGKYKNIGNMIFYSNDLEFTYIVNKKLQLYKQRVENSNQNLIFRITWQQIINSIVEYKSSWSLENMYIISYQKLDNQSQKDVEYIGIPKLQASILLDDTIRERLNASIQFRSDDFQGNKCWILEEFVKGKPLYPIIMNHINLCLNESKNITIYTSLYSLIVEAKILEFKNTKKRTLFSSDYFDNYRQLINDIKDEIRYTSFKASLIKQISKDEGVKERLARELLNALKTKDKNIFLNILLKVMNEAKMLASNSNFTDWIFEKLISNNINFEIYGLILVMNLLGDRSGE